MPSPAIPHSKSAPDITSRHSPPSVPTSSKSVVSSRSAGSHLASWSMKISKSGVSSRSAGSPLASWCKKLGGFITGKTKTSNLTEESLHEFNRSNALTEARYSTSSPYYKGLTDFSLVINRKKLSGSSPGRESRATSYVTSGSKSSFVVKVQEWGSSCFTSKNNDKSSYWSVSSWTKSSRDNRFTTSSSSSSSRLTETLVLKQIRTETTRSGSESEKKKVTVQFRTTEDSIISPTTEKPLRERCSEPPSMLPLPQPTASPPESLPYPLPQITLATAQALISPATALLSNAPPTPPPAVQAPPPQTPDAEGNTYENKARNTTRKERVYVWAEKYRPFCLQDFLCNREKALCLQKTVRSWHDTAEECGHFIFEGNPGVGKRTMIWALLREAFGPDKVQVREECKKFHLKGEAVGSILVNLMVSPQHIEVNLSELKGYEKHVIVELIKERSQMLSDSNLPCNQENCKAIILYEAGKLSTDALLYIKWMLEKFKGCNKVFFCCSDAKKLQPIIPICTYVQLNEPSTEEILTVLMYIAKQEQIQLPHQLAYKIANSSKNNLRQAIRSFEATWHLSGCSASLTEDQDIKTGWEDKISNIARNVIQEQSPKQLYTIRGELQNLIEHKVAPEFIFQTLKEEVKEILPEQLQPQLDQLYHEYQKNHALKKYSASAHQQEELGKRQNDQRKIVQQFMRIEEFIARFMSWYKGLAIKNKEVCPYQMQGDHLRI